MWVPTPHFRYAFKTGMTGWDVWALQINIRELGTANSGLLLDGAFGPATEALVKLHQKHHGLKMDGIAGIATQTSMCMQLSTPFSKQQTLPEGLLRGLIEGESGFAMACCTPHPSDRGFDLGAYQDAIFPGQMTETRFAHAFNVHLLGQETAIKIRGRHDYYRSLRVPNKGAWELAVLYHNWESAADNLAHFGRIYTSKPDDLPEQWIIAASSGRLRTAQEWVASYIANKFVYVTNYPE